MPISLLPASAAAFAPRSGPTIVLNSRVEPWLTQTLKRVNRVKRPLNSVPQHHRCLNELLSGDNAIWTLASLMLPKAPDSQLRKDPNPLVEAVFNYQLLHVEAYVVHVDMVSQHEVAFKLTPESIDALVEYHRDIYSVDVKATTWDWADKDAQLLKLHEDFVQAVNRYVYRTGVRALEGIEDEGAGELLEGRGEEVKNAIMGHFLPLLPPPPRIVDVVRPTTMLPSSPGNTTWWQPAAQVPSQPHSGATESWRMVPATPSPPIATCTEPQASLWSTLGLDDFQLPSPTPSYCQPYNSTLYCSPPPPVAAIPALPLPSLLAQQCGSSAVSAGFGSGFGWDTGFPSHFAAFT